MGCGCGGSRRPSQRARLAAAPDAATTPDATTRPQADDDRLLTNGERARARRVWNGPERRK